MAMFNLAGPLPESARSAVSLCRDNCGEQQDWFLPWSLRKVKLYGLKVTGNCSIVGKSLVKAWQWLCCCLQFLYPRSESLGSNLRSPSRLLAENLSFGARFPRDFCL